MGIAWHCETSDVNAILLMPNHIYKRIKIEVGWNFQLWSLFNSSKWQDTSISYSSSMVCQLIWALLLCDDQRPHTPPPFNNEPAIKLITSKPSDCWNETMPSKPKTKEKIANKSFNDSKSISKVNQHNKQSDNEDNQAKRVQLLINWSQYKRKTSESRIREWERAYLSGHHRW